MSESKGVFDKEIILLSESALESLLKDVGTFGLFVALIGTGWFLGSTAMQWLGALLCAMLIFGRAVSTAKQRTYTIAEARKRLDEIEAGK